MSEANHTRDNGGPAFPLPPPSPALHVSSGGPSYIIAYGMSLRDWFAGQALSQMASGLGPRPEHIDTRAAAERAYALADAMIEARK